MDYTTSLWCHTVATRRTISHLESSVYVDNPVDHLSQLSQHKVEKIPANREANDSKQEHSHTEYDDIKETIFPSEQPVEGTSQCIKSHEPQVAIQNIDQELLFKVAAILSASNDATQLITEWSQSPNKLQNNSLEEQLRHFAEHHQKVLTDSGSIPQNGVDKSQ